MPILETTPARKTLYALPEYRAIKARGNSDCNPKRRYLEAILVDNILPTTAAKMTGLNATRIAKDIQIRACITAFKSAMALQTAPAKSEYELALERRELLANFCEANPQHPAAVAFVNPPKLEHPFDPSCPNCDNGTTPYEWRDGHGLCREHRDRIRAIEHEAWSARFDACLAAAQDSQAAR